MKQKIKELRQKRQKAAEDMRALLDTAEKENRDLSTEEQKSDDDMFSAQDQLRKQIEREQRQLEIDREFAEDESRRQENDPEKRDGRKSEDELRMAGFNGFLAHGRSYEGDGLKEFRALQADSAAAGGFIRTPEQFVAQLIKDIDDETFVRQYATVLPMTNADGVGIPSLDADPADADWTSEIKTGNEDSSMAFGKRALKPHPLAKRIKVSETLLRQSALPAEQLVRERLAYKFGITVEKAGLTGSGAGQPLGLFTASTKGISTARDISTGNSTTDVTFDGLLEAKYGVKGGYSKNARWLFHRDGIKRIAKLKDGEGQYLWQPAKKDDEFDTLLGRPVHSSEYAPNTFTTGQYVGMYGDFSHYWIVDSLAFILKRLDELYAETNQVGFIGRLETDGMPVLENAFSRVKLA